jgi:NIMA (never in mitosis gene a)-related kinase
MTSALSALHRLEVVHCDLKSANVLISAEGDFKLGDLNVAKLSRDGVLTTQTGTPYYAAP